MARAQRYHPFLGTKPTLPNRAENRLPSACGRQGNIPDTWAMRPFRSLSPVPARTISMCATLLVGLRDSRLEGARKVSPSYVQKLRWHPFGTERACLPVTVLSWALRARKRAATL